MKHLFLITLLLGAGFAQAEDSEQAEQASAHVELDTTTIKASKELPSVMAVVPWKKALPAGLGGRPDKSLVDALLTPLDPDVFRRQQDFYQQLFVAKRESE
ncbi:MAG: hypothetical protein KJO54_03750 [Gammaproteobacteria bacterium]|nr:hypothetical protein [Gammaproteobacteria bacterium]NNF61778.1 hypothetical protein [Gammaproteobacteria bacterium]NNM20445.1 hypothetical protein [Gammaproteobacteria bacterium]